MPYIFARSYLDGGIDSGAFEPEKFTDPGVLSFMKLISVHEDPDMEAIYPGVVACRLTVATTSGEELTLLAENPRGHDLNRMTAEETSEKFRRLASAVLTAADVERALACWWSLADQASASRALAALGPAGA
jgi:2-methylcitrate dehydratase PrpD